MQHLLNDMMDGEHIALQICFYVWAVLVTISPLYIMAKMSDNARQAKRRHAELIATLRSLRN